MECKPVLFGFIAIAIFTLLCIKKEPFVRFRSNHSTSPKGFHHLNDILPDSPAFLFREGLEFINRCALVTGAHQNPCVDTVLQIPAGRGG